MSEAVMTRPTENLRRPEPQTKTSSGSDTEQKTVIITGAGGAIAEVVIKAFAEAGWRLALFEYSSAACDWLKDHYPESFVQQVDLTNEDSSYKAVEKTIAHFGKVDALLNIAGGFAMSEAVQTTRADLERQLDINFRTLFNATRAVLPEMLEQQRGFILGVGAKPALEGGAKMGVYAASKAAVVAYLKSLQAELGPKGIGVSILYPMGAVDTPANRKSMLKADPADWIDPQELAESILHLATRSKRGQIRELMVYPAR